jgi:hypothetical protein
MAGRGPAPKDRSKRARRNDDGINKIVLPFTRAPQPELPNGAENWPTRTREWWKMWGEAAQAELFTAADWEFLLETALLHARFWAGEAGFAAELRLRVAKFGATPEDRQRLRMEFAEDRPVNKPVDVQDRFANLRVIPGGADNALAGA